MAWFCIAFVSALAEHGAGGLKSETAKIRINSLRLVIGWLLLLLLMLNFAEDIAGQGTIYAWIWKFYKIIGVPVLLLLTGAVRKFFACWKKNHHSIPGSGRC